MLFSFSFHRGVCCCCCRAGEIALRLLSFFSWMTRSIVDGHDATFVAVDGSARLFWIRYDWKLL